MLFTGEIIRSRQNKNIVELCKLTDRKAREATKTFRFDGIKLLEEAIKKNPKRWELYKKMNKN